MKNRSAYLPAAFLGLLSVATLSACTASQGKPEAAATKAPAPIETFALKADTMNTALFLPGELIAYQQVDLYAKVNSFVKTLKADIGTEVKAGQLLATLEAPELLSQSAAAESKLKSQLAVYTASKSTYDRLLETSKTPGTISQNDLDVAFARKNSDFAQLEAAKAAHKEVTVIKDYLEIRAPFSGVITSKNVNPGAYVGPSGKGSELPLFTLQEQKHLRLAVSVPEANTGYLKPGDDITFTVRSLPSETFHAKITRMAGALDLRLRSEKIEMDVFNDQKQLLPGMVAEVHLPLNSAQTSFVVPKSAVVNSAEGLFVIKVIENKATRVPIKKGRETENKVEIFGSVNSGDILVSKASEEIRAGSTIK